MRIAIIGSGGAGKSVISATLARLLARRGRQVVAVDLDPNPGLAWSLGVAPSEGGLPDAAVAERDGGLYGWGLAAGIDPASWVATMARRAPDGVRFLASAKIDRADHAVSHHLGAVREIVDATPPCWDVVGDLEAGTTTPYEGYARFAERLMVVVTPSWRSGLAGRRLVGLFPDVPITVIGSQWRGEPDHVGLATALRIPFDRAVVEAERHGTPPLDACPDSPAIVAIASLADLLVGQEVAV